MMGVRDVWVLWIWTTWYVAEDCQSRYRTDGGLLFHSLFDLAVLWQYLQDLQDGKDHIIAVDAYWSAWIYKGDHKI